MLNKKVHSFSKFNLFFAILFWMITIACVIMIFTFSHQSAVESEHTSLSVLAFMNRFFGGGFSEGVIRKGAHIFEFLVLSIFTYFAIYNTNKVSVETSYSESSVKIIKSDNEMCIVFTTWFCILNAVIDEYHQLFVTGRSGSISDVAIDMIGVVFLMVLFRLLFTASLKIRGKTEVRYNE